MGIRYYAYPVDPEFIEQAQDDPEKFISSDPLMDAWGPADKRPTMLYLDKCWSSLQQLTRGDPLKQPRPAYRLFEGDVTPAHGGLAWYAWFRVLAPDQVAEIAQDIIDLTDDDVHSLISAYADPQRHDFGYVRSYLTAAQDFAVQMAKLRKGIIYMIG